MLSVIIVFFGIELTFYLGCDMYLPFGKPLSDSECSMPCRNNPTELCGGDNRLELYQNSAATPPNASVCIGSQAPGAVLLPRSFQNTGIVAVDHAGGNGLQIYSATPDINQNDTSPEYSLLSVSFAVPSSLYNLPSD